MERTHHQHRKMPGRRRTSTPRRYEYFPHPEADATLKSVFFRIGRPPETLFVPDPFQIQALEAIGHSDCLVTAPTGSGKTWIAEQAIRQIFQRGGRAWYASPLKALSNSKWVEFCQCFEDANVGILTGDTKENTEAPIIVGTTEILRNQLYDAMHKGEDLSCDLVILDEAHFLGDHDRGVVWEEVMIYLPTRIPLLLLSATIGNAHEIAAWLSTLRGKACRIVTSEQRPVPLYPLFLHPSGRLMPFLEKKTLSAGVKVFVDKERSHHRTPERPMPPAGVLHVLETYRLLPAIFFLKSRVDCDLALKNFRSLSSLARSEDFARDLGDLLERFPYLKNHKHLNILNGARVASHHGGQLPAWKFLVEEMMKRGHLRAIFATSTVAAGVNFPARTIVMFHSDLFNGHEFEPLTSTEFHQMTGRAGRRGRDRIGFMLLVPGRFMDIRHIRRLLFTEPEDIISQIRNDFSMILNLLLSQTPENIREIFQRSFATFQQQPGKKEAKTADELWADFCMHLEFLKTEGFVDHCSR
ncbi:MAG: DEAD/DEAH box helicase, partial [Syntrophales bacterium]